MKKRRIAILFLFIVSLLSFNGISGSATQPDIPHEPVLVEKEVITLECPAVAKLSTEQKNILVQSIQIGDKHNLGYVLAAIAWVESQAGMYPINANTHAYSPYHILLKTALARRNVPDTNFNRSAMASRLVGDLEYSADLAIEEVQFWQKVRGKQNTFDWLASYNGGWKAAEKSESIDYATKVMQKTQQLKRCTNRETVLVASI